MILHFKRTDVEKLIQNSLAATEHKTLYEQPHTAAPGLWLVGDDGIYLMSNSKEGLKVESDMPSEAPHFVVYARECDPKNKEAAEDWWSVKRAAFGGDDGADYIPYQADKKQCLQSWLEGNPGVEFLQMDLSPGEMSLVGAELLPIEVGKAQEFFKKKGAENLYQDYYLKAVDFAAFDMPVAAMGRKDLIVYIGWLRERKNVLEAQLKQQQNLLKGAANTIGKLEKKPVLKKPHKPLVNKSKKKKK